MEGNIMSTNQLLHIKRVLNRLMRRSDVINFMRAIDREENCIHIDKIKEKLQKNAYTNGRECLREIFSIFHYCYTNFKPGALIRSTARDLERLFSSYFEDMPPKEVAVRNPIRLPRPKKVQESKSIAPKRQMEDDESFKRQFIMETIMETDESSDEELNLEKEIAQLYVSQQKLSELLPRLINDFNDLTTAIYRFKAMTPNWHGETPTPEYEYHDEQQMNDDFVFGLADVRARVNYLFRTQKEYSSIIDQLKTSVDTANTLLSQVKECINQIVEDDNQSEDETSARTPIKARIKVIQKRLDDGSISKSYELV